MVEVDSVNATPEQTTTKNSTTSLSEVLVPKSSPNSLNTDRNVVFVIDALAEFPWRSFKWTLDHLIPTGCTVTLLGVMPWIPLALSCKTRLWTYDFGNLSALKFRSDWKNEQKYQQIRWIVELCEQKGVIPHMQLAMGHPLKLVVLEKTTSLHASLVVLDRHLRKNKAYFAEKLPSSVVMMNSDGGVDIIKIQSKIINQCDLSPAESPAALPPTKVIVSKQLTKLLNHKESSQQQFKNEACRTTNDSLLTRTRREVGQLFLGKAM